MDCKAIYIWLVASHFLCPLQGPCPCIQVQKWTWSGYLTSMLSAFTPVCVLRSASHGLLVEPRSRLKTVGDRAFSFAGPHEWNHLPGEIRDCQTLQEKEFKRKLKNHLFRAAYGL